MFSLRPSLNLLAGPAGLIAALVLWLALGRTPPAAAQIEQLSAQLRAAPAPVRMAAPVDDPAARALASPLFALTTGPGAVVDVPVHLAGLAITPGHRAVLLGIGDKPPVWLELGATRDGVTVMAISAAGVTIDTETGFKTLGLSDSPTPAAQSTGSQK